MKHLHRLFFATLTAAAATTAAQADIRAGDTEITLTLTSVSPSRAVSAYFNDTTTGTVYNRVIQGGQLNWDAGIGSFCVQLLESVTIGATRTFDAVEVEDVPDAPPGPGPMGSLRATLIKDLYARHYSDLSAPVSGTEARNRSAAFAMIIWEITHQDSSATTALGVLADLDLTAGNARFNSSSSVNSLASGWLNGLGGGTGDFQDFTNLIGLTDPTTQDFLIVVPGPAGMMAFAGLAATRSRRRR